MMFHDWSPHGTRVCYNCGERMGVAAPECRGGDAAEPENAEALLREFFRVIAPMQQVQEPPA